jgi:hypothetical protein
MPQWQSRVKFVVGNIYWFVGGCEQWNGGGGSGAWKTRIVLTLQLPFLISHGKEHLSRSVPPARTKGQGQRR